MAGSYRVGPRGGCGWAHQDDGRASAPAGLPARADFSDRIDDEGLHFDYRLRPGVATTTNALHVLRMEGIDVTDAGPG